MVIAAYAPGTQPPSQRSRCASSVCVKEATMELMLKTELYVRWAVIRIKWDHTFVLPTTLVPTTLTYIPVACKTFQIVYVTLAILVSMYPCADNVSQIPLKNIKARWVKAATRVRSIHSLQQAAFTSQIVYAIQLILHWRQALPAGSVRNITGRTLPAL